MLFFYGMRRYGKRNVSTRFGVCEACGTAGDLETYDTARFFHLYWLPLIPLGHVKIIDACPHCQKCRVISPRKYNKLKQQNEDTLLGKLREAPDDPDLVCEALNHWSAYNDAANFEKMATLYRSRIPGNAQVMKSISIGYYRLGRFSKALEAAKSLPDTETDKTKVIEAAQAHLDVEARGEERDRKPGGISIFLPYLVPLLIIVSVIGSFVGKGFTAGKYREVWLVNGSLRPYTVRIDEKTYELSSLSRQRITLSMGEHRAQIVDTPIECEPFDFEYNLSFTQRMSDDKLLVLNPDSLAFLMLSHVPYIANGSSRTAEPRFEYHFGKQWHVLDNVDYPFRESPDNIDMPAGRTVTYKKQLELYEPGSYDELLSTLFDYGEVHDFAPYAEATLRLHPDYADADWMLAVVLGSNDIDSLTILDQGLKARPVLIEWHRFYQTYMERKNPEHDLVAEYQALLEAEPNEPALHYLRGRVDPDADKSIAYFTAAEANQGCGGYGYNAIAYNFMCRMQYDKAYDYTCKAREQAGDASRFDEIYASACLAARQYQPLIDSIRLKKMNDPDNGDLVALEVRYLQLMGQPDEAVAAEAAYITSTAHWMEDDMRKGWEDYFAAVRCYADGEVENYLEQLAAVLPERADYEKALHVGNAKSALDTLIANDDHNYAAYLTVFGSAMHHGQKDVADQALQKAIEMVDSRPEIKAYLTGENHPSPDLLAEAEILPEEKLLVASTLGYLYPDQQSNYFKLVRTCNFSPFSPQLLVASWIE